MEVHIALLISTTCQRFSLGFYIYCVIAHQLLGIELPMTPIAIVALAFLGIGGIASILHLGRPNRFLNSFSNLRSHLSQEALLIPFLGVSLLICCADGIIIDLGAVASVFQWIAALISLIFLISTGLVYQLRSRPAWDTPLVLMVFLMTAAEAGSLSLLAVSMFVGSTTVSLLVLTSLSLVACIIAQYFYLKRLPNLGYGVNIRIGHSTNRYFFIFWLLFGVLVPVLSLIAVIFKEQAVFAYIGAGSSLIGIIFWTMMFYKFGLKIKMFPMYSVDLNEYM